MNKDQENVTVVLHRMLNMLEKDEGYADMFCIQLDNMLDEIHHSDGFGTEGQCDPRGDFREGEWSMWNVEGADK